MESPEEIVEADGYVFRIVSYRNIFSFVFSSATVLYTNWQTLTLQAQVVFMLLF